jgi:polysaccharide pyruvyl transferase WcaK-like protein
MIITQERSSSCDEKDVVKSGLACGGGHHSAGQSSKQGPRIALLTPYNGGNLGDAAIQDALIANIRLRLPDAQFSGISLNCDEFVERHGGGAFPIRGTLLLHGWADGRAANQARGGETVAGASCQEKQRAVGIKSALKAVPLLGRCLKTIHTWGREVRHCSRAYAFLRTQDLLIVSGGGQLCDRWGGPWHHPFALFKWALLAQIAQIPYVVASVGATNDASMTSRLFMSAALRMARYRSFRDKDSREIASGFTRLAARDSIVPDIAFSLPTSELPQPAGVRELAQGRTIVAISPIAYAKPGRWPREDRALHNRYVQQMASVVSQLLERDYFLVMVWSSLADDESVIPEILALLDQRSKQKLARQMHIATISSWKDLVASLMDVDFLIASRLHSAILGFVSRKPTIAISFDPKVDWMMGDLGQADYLLQIGDFEADDVIESLNRLKLRKDGVIEQIGSYQRRILSTLAVQYDALAQLAAINYQRRN